MTGQERHIANAQQSYTLASRTSQCTDQNFVKEFAKPTQEKLVLIPLAIGTRPFKKNKTRKRTDQHDKENDS